MEYKSFMKLLPDSNSSLIFMSKDLGLGASVCWEHKKDGSELHSWACAVRRVPSRGLSLLLTPLLPTQGLCSCPVLSE